LISQVERSGVGWLERERDGRVGLRFAEPLPDVDAAWRFAFWDGDPPDNRRPRA
jgi:hypothetical protein